MITASRIPSDRRSFSPRVDDPGPAGGDEAEQVARSREQQRRDDERRARQQPAAAQADRDDDRRHHQRAEPVTDVAADREERHPARPLAPARVGGELRALRVVGGRPEPGDDHAARRRASTAARRRRPPSRSRRPPRPPGRSQIAPRASDQSPNSGWTIDDESADASIEHGDERVGEAELGLEEREQRRQRPAGEVDGRVTGREQRHRPPVDLVAHARSVSADSIAPPMEIAASAARPPRRTSPPSPSSTLSGGCPTSIRGFRRSSSRAR